MAMPIPLRCHCGTVRGTLAGVTAADQKRAVCYCDDCQIYAQHLGRSDLLDAHGGTEAVMTAPAQVTFSQGAAELRCVRLSPKGLYRWYAGCCNTPLGNAVGPRLPVLIVPTASVDVEALGQSLDEALGPPAVHIQTRFAKGGLPAGVQPTPSFSFLPRVVSHLLRGFLKGRTQPSPFFDAQGQPRVPPQLIDKDKRESIRARIVSEAV